MLVNLSHGRKWASCFNRKFGEDLEVAVSAFISVHSSSVQQRLLNCYQQEVTFKSLSSHFLFPKFWSIKAWIPKYLAAAEDVSPTVDTIIIVWWKRHTCEWPPTLVKDMLVQPSSAVAERVFSILSNSFTDTQRSSLEDYIETSIMMQYNNKDCL